MTDREGIQPEVAFAVRCCDHLHAWADSLPDDLCEHDGWAAYQAYQQAVLMLLWPGERP